MLDLLNKNVTQGNVTQKFETRPWGGFYVLHTEPECKVKRLIIEVGAKTSLQFHQHRSEHLIIERGNAKVFLAEHELHLEEGEKFDVPKGIIHRIENCGNAVLQILEVQSGKYLDESDIVRLHDVYERV